jgi:hypothetical protein
MHALRVVDTFGRVQNLTLHDDKVMATEIMTTPANPHLVLLPPRLVQPARLNFRWLAADESMENLGIMPRRASPCPPCG